MLKTWNSACPRVAATFAPILCLSQFTFAAINYGPFGPVSPGVSFIGVTESSGTDPEPLVGPPQAYSIGLDFDPIGFVSYAQGGAGDSTAGQLIFTLSTTIPSVRLDGISLFEAGDYTLSGTGTAATSVLAAANINATVTQINGLPVAPIALTPVNASVSDTLPGTVIVQPWSLGAFLDVHAQLAVLGYSASDFATSIDVTINNTLTTTSQATSAAFIAKKDFRVDVQTILFIPEPGSLLLAVTACGALLLRRR